MKKLFLLSTLLLTIISTNIFGMRHAPLKEDKRTAEEILAGEKSGKTKSTEEILADREIPETMTMPLNSFIALAAKNLKINIIPNKELDMILTYPTWISTAIYEAGQPGASTELFNTAIEWLTKFFTQIGYHFIKVDGIYHIIKK